MLLTRTVQIVTDQAFPERYYIKTYILVVERARQLQAVKVYSLEKSAIKIALIKKHL